MGRRTTWLALFAVSFMAALAGTGWYILYYSEINPPTPAPHTLQGLLKVVFGFHLALWMVLGMMFNYLWDLFRSQKSWADITWRELLTPMLVFPIVFFSVWSIWNGAPMSFSFPLIAFQNGFFWQVVFSKAGVVAPDQSKAVVVARK